MDGLYTFHSSTPYPNLDSTAFLGDGLHHDHQELVLVPETHDQDAAVLEMSDLIKAQIANHPLYPNLLSAYIDCRKVGAPPEMASILEEISKENHPTISPTISPTTQIGTDPELDDFMKSYCEALQKYKEELSKPFDEATNFLSSIESQLTHLCKQTLPSTTHSYQSPGCGSEEEMSGGDQEVEGAGCSSSGNNGEGDEELKEMLMRKYSGYLSSLRKEFLKKRKKGKLPKDAISALLDWWNTHYRWPYPTEEEKNRLSEMTGLDQKQINNWFINQRKRHWRPSEDMRFALMEGVADDRSVFFDATGGTGGIGT